MKTRTLTLAVCNLIHSATAPLKELAQLEQYTCQNLFDACLTMVH